MTPEEFAKVKAGITAATDVLAGVIERDAEGQWDYLIVAVPVNGGNGSTQIGLMSSVDALLLPDFLRYLLNQFERCAAAGGVYIEEKNPGRPS